MDKLFLFCFTLLSLSLFSNKIEVFNSQDIQNSNPQPGDTLFMMKSGNWVDQEINLNFDGLSSSPIVILAEEAGEVILSGSSRLVYNGNYLIVSGLTFRGCASTENRDLVSFRLGSNQVENCRLTNSLFTDNNPTDLNVGYKWVSLYGENNRVDHCWFEKKNHRGTTLVVWLDTDDSPNNHRIDHNYFTRPELSTGNNEAETIRIGDSRTSLVDSRTVVEYNYFEECDGEIESISNKSGYNVYRYNTFFNNRSILTLRHGHFCKVEKNYFFGNNKTGSGGVRIIGFGHHVINNYFQDIASSGSLRAPVAVMGGVDGLGIEDATNRYVASEDNLVAFNSFVNCKGVNIYIGSDKTKPADGEIYKAPRNNTIENNLFFGFDGKVLDFQYEETTNTNYNGNIYFGLDLNKSSSDGFLNQDPKLNTTTGFQPASLTSASPAINASLPTVYTSSFISYVEPMTDIEDQTRTSLADVGADEFSTESSNGLPILKPDVGPCWMGSGDCSETITSTKNLEKTLLKIYPNPVKDFLIISGDSGLITWEVLDTSGKTLQYGESSTVELVNFESGVYFLRDTRNGAFYKFIKQ